MIRNEETVRDSELKQYGTQFLEVLNTVYEDYCISGWCQTSMHLAFFFHWGQPPRIPETVWEEERYVYELLNCYFPEASVTANQEYHIFHNNQIVIVKPKGRYYWLPPVAILDADEIFASLVRQEYNLT